MCRAKFLSVQFFILLAGSALSAADAETPDDFRAAAEKANAVLTILDGNESQRRSRLPHTSFVSYFGHLNGYDAGYYGYGWADAIAADLATVFENASDGYLDKQAGMRLRREIYEPGDSRDVNLSIEKFLSRRQSIQPFLKKIGVAQQAKKDAAGRG